VRNCRSIPEPDNEDYIEINELTAQLSLHNEIGLPRVAETSSSMGGSLRRPKISLTWVLREQNQSQSQQHKKSSIDWNGTAEKKFFKKTKSREKLFSEKYVNEGSNNLSSDFRGDAKLSDDSKLQTEYRKPKRFHEDCCSSRQRQSPDTQPSQINDCTKTKSLSQANLSSKNTYSEPSIYVTSAQSDSGVKRHRRRRKKFTKFGYNIKNVNDFLSGCTLSNPANIPVVLSNPSILYQTRTGYHQVELHLPLGMVLNSVFKNENWLYCQTPHGEEGYVSFAACLPLGILTNNR